MGKKLTFDSNTNFTLSEDIDIQDVHMKDLSFVLDVDIERDP